MRVLIATLLLALSPIAAGSPATEAEPDCEDGQPWVGYRRAEPLREAYAAQGSPGGLALCEGEHWDGQDPTGAPVAECVVCMGADPNGESGADPFDPLGVRVSADGSSVYVAANAFAAARFAVYADEDTLAVYARDNTPGNIVATLMGSPSPVPPYVSEADCDQATYQTGAMTGQQMCGRDNTAITLQHALLA